MKLPFVRGLAALWLALAVGCSSNPIAPTFPQYATVSRYFSGSMAPGGAPAVFTFSVKIDGAIRVTLGSVTSSATGEPDATPLAVGFGTPSGASCSATTSQTAAAALTGQLTSTITHGDYCVVLTDPGALTQPVKFTIRVVTSVGATPGIGLARADSLPGSLSRNSQSLKTFSTNTSGDMSLTFTEIGTNPALAIKIGLGIWDGSACRLNTTIVSAPSTDPLISTTADAGDYCVLITDVGNLTAQVLVTGVIIHR